MTSNVSSIKKLSAYSAMAISFLYISDSAKAQVVYTDIDPDLTFDNDGQFYEVDLNNDAVVDLNIKVFSYSVSSFFSTTSGGVYQGIIQGVFAFPENGAELAGYALGGSANPYAMNFDDPIDSDLPFYDNTIQALVNFQAVVDYPVSGSLYVLLSYGYWNGAMDQYLAVKFNIGTDTHYGYIRLDVSDDHHEFTIKDFAYNSTPDEALNAGDIGLAVETMINDEQVTCFSHQNMIHYSIFDNQIIDNAMVNIFDLNGRLIYAEKVNDTYNTIFLNHTPTGNYFFQLITSDNKVYNRQLYIQN